MQYRIQRRPGATFALLPVVRRARRVAGGRAIVRNYEPETWGERFIAWRWWLKDRLLSHYVSEAAPIVIGGCGRSGTTLLQVIFDAHPDLCCVRETSILHPRKLQIDKLSERMKIPHDQLRHMVATSRRHGEFVDRVFAEFCARNGVERWAEKSPKNVRRLDSIFWTFPRARFVHVIRDGRDSVCSQRTHNRVQWVDGERVQTGPLRPVAQCARRWVNDVRAGLAWRDHPQATEIRYEELVADLEGSLRRLFETLGESFSADMLGYYRKHSALSSDPNFKKPIFGSSVGRWRRDLSPEDAATVERICGPLLVELGYTRDGSWVAEAGTEGSGAP